MRQSIGTGMMRRRGGACVVCTHCHVRCLPACRSVTAPGRPEPARCPSLTHTTPSSARDVTKVLADGGCALGRCRAESGGDAGSHRYPRSGASPAALSPPSPDEKVHPSPSTTTILARCPGRFGEGEIKHANTDRECRQCELSAFSHGGSSTSVRFLSGPPTRYPVALLCFAFQPRMPGLPSESACY